MENTKTTDSLSIDEKIELFRNTLVQVTANADLPVSIVYMIAKDYLQELNTVYTEYREQIQSTLNSKLSPHPIGEEITIPLEKQEEGN